MNRAFNDCGDTADFVRSRLGFEPGALQRRILEDIRRGIVCCHRQFGKSTLIAAKAVHRAICSAGSLTLIIAPSQRQSAETVRKAELFTAKAGIRPRGDGDNRVSILFPNGSRIIGLPESEHTVVGFSSVSLLIIDEAARVPDSTYFALRPMLLQSDGDLWLLSTPLGKRGFFYEAWRQDGWTKLHVPVTENPRIRKEFIEEERMALPKARFQQDYLCEFLQPDNAIFNEEDIQALFQSDVDPLD